MDGACSYAQLRQLTSMPRGEVTTAPNTGRSPRVVAHNGHQQVALGLGEDGVKGGGHFGRR